jgi:hypothetical protein
MYVYRRVQAAVEGVASDRATFVTSVLPETGPGSMPSTEITSYKPTNWTRFVNVQGNHSVKPHPSTYCCGILSGRRLRYRCHRRDFLFLKARSTC